MSPLPGWITIEDVGGAIVCAQSVLFDRTTVPDDVFRRIVSYHGSLCPRRPWLEAARERGDSSDSGSGSESES